MNFHDGLYDEVVSSALWGALSKATSEGERTLGPLAAEDVSERLAEALARQLARILDDLGGSGEERAHRQLELINSILMDVRHRLGGHGNQIENFHAPLQLLHSIHRRTTPLVLPDTGLAMPWLFTAGKGSPSLVDRSGNTVTYKVVSQNQSKAGILRASRRHPSQP